MIEKEGFAKAQSASSPEEMQEIIQAVAESIYRDAERYRAMSESLPELPELPFLPPDQKDRALIVRWATEYGRACVAKEREQCAVICDELMATSRGRQVAQHCAAAIRSQEK